MNKLLCSLPSSDWEQAGRHQAEGRVDLWGPRCRGRLHSAAPPLAACMPAACVERVIHVLPGLKLRPPPPLSARSCAGPFERVCLLGIMHLPRLWRVLLALWQDRQGRVNAPPHNYMLQALGGVHLRLRGAQAGVGTANLASAACPQLRFLGGDLQAPGTPGEAAVPLRLCALHLCAPLSDILPPPAHVQGEVHHCSPTLPTTPQAPSTKHTSQVHNSPVLAIP